MKTLCLTLGLLLLVFCCCNAMPSGVQYSTGSGNCCVNFSTSTIPKTRVTNIIKTHRSCLKKGFIVTTVLKRQLCYRQTFDWALNVYNRFYNTEGSSWQ